MHRGDLRLGNGVHNSGRRQVGGEEGHLNWCVLKGNSQGSRFVTRTRMVLVARGTPTLRVILLGRWRRGLVLLTRIPALVATLLLVPLLAWIASGRRLRGRLRISS